MAEVKNLYDMKLFTTQSTKLLDQLTIEYEPIDSIDLMERAAEALTEEISKTVSPDRRLYIFAGPGNNGGDALATARLLLGLGYQPAVYLFNTMPNHRLSPDCARNCDRLRATGITQFYEITNQFTPPEIEPGDVVIDGLFGAGLHDPLSGGFASLVRYINESEAFVISIDIPSGLNADDGSAELCVTADLTVTMAAVKTGMLTRKGPNASGRVAVARIGSPDRYLEEAGGDYELFTKIDARNLLAREPFDTFKNRRGHLAVIGGSADYCNAPFLSGEAALRTGAGLVTVLLPASADILCSVRKALIVRRIADASCGCFNETSLQQLEQEILPMQALAAGPGLSHREEILPVLELLTASGKPLVLDADALNLLARNPELLEEKRNNIILTPHPGEMARLQKAYGLDGTKHRIEQALDLSYVTGAVVILKGSRSVTASPDGDYCINMSGCAALSTAGSGDTLTGICGALLAEGFDAWDAARLGVFLHGLCGEILAPYGSRGILADDLADVIPQALKRILPTA